MKKILAILIVSLLLVPCICLPASAATEGNFSFLVENTNTNKSVVYNGDVFNVSVLLNGLSTWAGTTLAFTYDSSVIELQSQTPVYTVASDTSKYILLPPLFSEGYVSYSVGLGLVNPNLSEPVGNNFKIVTFTFKAISSGSMNLAFFEADTSLYKDLNTQVSPSFTPDSTVVKELGTCLVGLNIKNNDNTKENVFIEDTFTVTAYIEGLTTWGGAAVAFSYDNSVIELVSQTPVYTIAADTLKYIELPSSFGNNTIIYTVALNLNNLNDSEPAPAGFSLVSFTFKAKAIGNMGLSLVTEDSSVFKDVNTSVSIEPLATDYNVLEQPVAPTASDLTFSENEVRYNGTVTASFIWADANPSDTEGTHKFSWFVDNIEVPGANSSVFTINKKEYVGKTLTYKVIPVSSNPDDPAASEYTVPSGLIIKAENDYKPGINQAETSWVTSVCIKKPILVNYVLNNDYPNATDSSVINWYVVDTQTEAITGLTPYATGKTAVFSANLTSKYAVIEIIPKVSIAGELFKGDAVISSAFLIKPTVDVNYKPKFNSPQIAMGAKINFLFGAEKVADLLFNEGSNGFMGDVVPGIYKLVIQRPGYVTVTLDCRVDSSLENGIDVELPEMIAGDITNDGKIDVVDFNKLKGNFNKKKDENNTSWNDEVTACDFNADGKVNLYDFNMMKPHFNYNRDANN